MIKILPRDIWDIIGTYLTFKDKIYIRSTCSVLRQNNPLDAPTNDTILEVKVKGMKKIHFHPSVRLKLEATKIPTNIYPNIAMLKTSNFTGLNYMSTLTNLDLSNACITCTSLLCHLKLKVLDLSSNDITDIYPIGQILTLEFLDLGNNYITEIDQLKHLNKLKTLMLNYNCVRDLVPLASLTDLEMLNINNNLVSDISPLKHLTKLITFTANFNIISNIEPLTNHIKLKALDLSNNEITNIEPLRHCISLETLRLVDNVIINMDVVESLTNLKYIKK